MNTAGEDLQADIALHNLAAEKQVELPRVCAGGLHQRALLIAGKRTLAACSSPWRCHPQCRP